MYTYETAMARLPASARQAGPTRDSGVESAFRHLEQRGASNAQWETLITRISSHYNGTGPPPISDEMRDRVMGCLEDPRFPDDFRMTVFLALH